MPKPKYSTFCEWVIGKNVQQIAAAQDKKKPAPTEPSPKRDIVRVEVTTDDEAEEDSLTVTYPRSAKSASINAAEEDVVIKKVRFQQMPTKSALKKSTTVVVESESTTDSESETTEAESTEISPKKKSKSRSKTKKKKKRLTIDPNPHPTCKCGSCVRSRHHFKILLDESTSESDTETIANKPQPSKHKHIEADSDYEASSEPSTKSEAEVRPSAKAEKTCDDKAKKASKGEAAKQKEGRSRKVKIETRKGRAADKDYPEAMPGPHPRRPHLIEPIRAEVVQTERVVESAEDPPPNAYYDATHGVLRVYHGPAYGGRFGHALYPRRDASNHPLPIGTPHPLNNPYLYGFDSGKQGQQSSFRPTYPPPPPAMADGGYAPMAYPPNGHGPGGGYPYSGFAPGGASAPWPPPAAPPGNGSRGAFSMFAANNGSPFSRLGDEGGGNNVAPGSLQGNNPYYPGRSKSGPSATGSRAPDSGGHPDGGTDGAWPTSDGAADGARGSWGNEQTEANWNDSEQPGAPCPNGTEGDEPTNAMPGAWESQEQSGEAWDSQQDQQQQPSSGWDSREADGWNAQKPSPKTSQW
ncbi:hypothetical protein CDD80_2601 [Ophiocordyceps camponoti-rufipedis]|uniref:Uncharacterized protein n=1 Tax=Ophiocordyceps camponoti-rufipedis TaxID=2004952 RepID=A0A2C5Z7K7_9HYPO|nr:hypothetical protein CDD80_2601 [Ophiocordyceps camponoti-rufipedis]